MTSGAAVDHGPVLRDELRDSLREVIAQPARYAGELEDLLSYTFDLREFVVDHFGPAHDDARLCAVALRCGDLALLRALVGRDARNRAIIEAKIAEKAKAALDAARPAEPPVQESSSDGPVQTIIQVGENVVTWNRDGGVSGGRWLALLEKGDAYVYDDGRWLVRPYSSLGDTSGAETTAELARARSLRVYEALTDLRPVSRPNPDAVSGTFGS